MRKFIAIGFAALLSACSLTPEEVTLDTAILTEHTNQVRAKAEVATNIANACKATAPQINCTSESCAAMAVVAQVVAQQSQSQCVQAVAKEAGNVAVVAPLIRMAAIVGVTDGLFGWLREATPDAAQLLFGRAAFDFGKEAIFANAQAVLNSQQANIDQSVTTTTTTTTTTGDTLTASRDIIGGDATIADNGSQIGDGDDVQGDLTGGDNVEGVQAGGDICHGTQCQPNDIQNPIDNSGDDPTVGLVALPSPIADGICLSIWNEETRAGDPDCG